MKDVSRAVDRANADERWADADELLIAQAPPELVAKWAKSEARWRAAGRFYVITMALIGCASVGFALGSGWWVLAIGFVLSTLVGMVTPFSWVTEKPLDLK